MEHREKVEIITGILQANEEILSDGYHYYCGDVEKTLAGIAEAILTGIEGVPTAGAELLDALTELLAFEDFSISEKIWRGEYRASIYKARAAIARAKGEA